MKPTHPEPQGPSSSPLPPPPRTVRRRPGRGRLLGRVPLVIRLLGLAAVALLLAALWLWGSSALVTLLGTTVPAKVTNLLPAPSDGVDPPRVRFAYHIGIQEYTGEDAVSQAAFAKLYDGAPLRVKVLRPWPGNPRLLEPPSQSGGHAGLLLGLAVLGNVAVGIAAWRSLRKPLAQRGLVRDGFATAGQVVLKEAEGGRPPWLVQFTYWAPTRGLAPGALGDGSGVATREWQVVMEVRRQDFEAARVGQAVTVLYDPRKPSRSLVYAFADYEAVDGAPAHPHQESSGPLC